MRMIAENEALAYFFMNELTVIIDAWLYWTPVWRSLGSDDFMWIISIIRTVCTQQADFTAMELEILRLVPFFFTDIKACIKVIKILVKALTLFECFLSMPFLQVLTIEHSII